MQLDLSHDFVNVVDNLESIDYVHETNTGTMSDTFQNCFRRALSTNESAKSGGVYVKGDVVFFIPSLSLSPTINPPRVADQILDQDGNEYTILDVDALVRDKSRNPTLWKCITRNLTIQFQLQDIIEIDGPVLTLDSAGVELQTFRPKYQNVACRVQDVGDDVQDQRGIRGMVRKFNIYLGKELNVTTRMRVVSAVGTLDVTGYQSRMRIDELPFITAELRV